MWGAGLNVWSPAPAFCATKHPQQPPSELHQNIALPALKKTEYFSFGSTVSVTAQAQRFS